MALTMTVEYAAKINQIAAMNGSTDGSKGKGMLLPYYHDYCLKQSLVNGAENCLPYSDWLEWVCNWLSEQQ